MKNEGKKFEEDFAKSAPEHLDFTRLVDAGGWGKASNLRFTPSNLCDFIAYSEITHILYKMELKSVAGTSLPFGNINEKKLDKLILKDTLFIRPVFVINFRGTNHTYLINAKKIKIFMIAGGRKSIPLVFAHENGIRIEQKLIRVRWKYDLSKL